MCVLGVGCECGRMSGEEGANNVRMLKMIAVELPDSIRATVGL